MRFRLDFSSSRMETGRVMQLVRIARADHLPPRTYGVRRRRRMEMPNEQKSENSILFLTRRAPVLMERAVLSAKR